MPPDPDKGELERLFLLEVLVDKVNFDKPPKQKNLKETCVDFYFLNYPPLSICEEDFAPNIYGYDNLEVAFHSGKSCLFSLPSSVCQGKISNFNLDISVNRIDEKGCKLEIGRNVINLSSSFANLLNVTESQVNSEPVTKTTRNAYPFVDAEGETVGTVTAFIRLSCFGKLIITKFEVRGPDAKSFIFKGADERNAASDVEKVLKVTPLDMPSAPGLQTPSGMGGYPGVTGEQDIRMGFPGQVPQAGLVGPHAGMFVPQGGMIGPGQGLGPFPMGPQNGMMAQLAPIGLGPGMMPGGFPQGMMPPGMICPPCPPCSGSAEESSSSSSLPSSSSSSSSDDSENEPPINFEFCDCNIPLPPGMDPNRKKDLKKKKLQAKKKRDEEIRRKLQETKNMCGLTCGDPRCEVSKMVSTGYKCWPITKGYHEPLSPGTCCYLGDQAIFQTDPNQVQQLGDATVYKVSDDPQKPPQLVQMVKTEDHPELDDKNDTFTLNFGKTDASGKPAKLLLSFKSPKVLDEKICTTEHGTQYLMEDYMHMGAPRKSGASKKSKKSKGKKGKKGKKK